MNHQLEGSMTLSLDYLSAVEEQKHALSVPEPHRLMTKRDAAESLRHAHG